MCVSASIYLFIGGVQQGLTVLILPDLEPSIWTRLVLNAKFIFNGLFVSVSLSR